MKDIQELGKGWLVWLLVLPPVFAVGQDVQAGSAARFFQKTNIPKFSIRYGTTPGDWEDAPYLQPIYGSQKVDYYNTPFWSGERFAPDEPDNFLQIGIRKNARWAYSLLLMKQKYDPDANGFKLEAPTAIEFGFSQKRGIFQWNWLEIAADFSGSAGFVLADAKFVNRPNESVNKPWFTLSGYSPVGFGATAIARLDAVFFDLFALFVAGNVHHYQGTTVKTSIGPQRVRYLGSVEMTVGIGFDFGKK